MLTNVERRNLRGTARLLRAELVAREEQEAEAACFVLVPERDEPGHLPNVSQASDVDDEDYLACEDVERDVLARVGAGAQIRETRHMHGGTNYQHGALGRKKRVARKLANTHRLLCLLDSLTLLTGVATRLTHSVDGTP